MKSSPSTPPKPSMFFVSILSQISFSLAMVASLGALVSVFEVAEVFALAAALVFAAVFAELALLGSGVVLHADIASRNAESRSNRFIGRTPEKGMENATVLLCQNGRRVKSEIAIHARIILQPLSEETTGHSSPLTFTWHRNIVSTF